MDSFSDVIQKLGGLSTEELHEVNRQAVAILKARRNVENRTAKNQFSKGQEVEFDAKGHVNRGVITRINRVTIDVDVQHGKVGPWRVHPRVLRMYSEMPVG